MRFALLQQVTLHDTRGRITDRFIIGFDSDGKAWKMRTLTDKNINRWTRAENWDHPEPTKATQ